MITKKLALDIGTVRIGVAISDGLGLLAHPLTTLKWKNVQTLLKEINDLLEKNDIESVIVGVPLTMKGQQSEQTKRVLSIIGFLEENLNVPIIQIDERLTTKMAEMQLRDAGKQASRSRNIIDQIAAVNILQTYLDKTI